MLCVLFSHSSKIALVVFPPRCCRLTGFSHLMGVCRRVYLSNLNRSTIELGITRTPRFSAPVSCVNWPFWRVLVRLCCPGSSVNILNFPKSYKDHLRTPLKFLGHFFGSQLGLATLQKKAYAFIATVHRAHWVLAARAKFNLLTNYHN